MEQEIRVKVDDFSQVRQRLSSKGGTRAEEAQDDEYFGSLATYEATNKAFILRIRTSSDGKKVFTYKGATGKLGVYDEMEMEIEDAKTMNGILLKMGFEHIALIKKRRETYNYGESSVNLDSIDGLGKFVEIEIQADGIVEDRLRSLVSELGLGGGEVVRKGYLSMLLEQRRSPYSKYIKE